MNERIVSSYGCAGNLDERRSRERDADNLALAAVVFAAAGRAAVEALRRQAGTTHDAGAVTEYEGRDDEVTRLEGTDVRAHLLHHADQLVPDRSDRVRREAAVIPEV